MIRFILYFVFKISMNVETASMIAMQTRLVTMYRGAITVNVRKDLLEAENTVKVKINYI